MGLSAEEISILSFLERPADYTKKDNIFRIVNYISILQEEAEAEAIKLTKEE